MSGGDFEKIAKMAAKEAVTETFLMLGVDVSSPAAVQSAQNQFATLRNIHYGMRHVRNVIISGVLGMAVSGAGWAFWAGFKVSAAAPIAATEKAR